MTHDCDCGCWPMCGCDRASRLTRDIPVAKPRWMVEAEARLRSNDGVHDLLNDTILAPSNEVGFCDCSYCLESRHPEGRRA